MVWGWQPFRKLARSTKHSNPNALWPTMRNFMKTKTAVVYITKTEDNSGSTTRYEIVGDMDKNMAKTVIMYLIDSYFRSYDFRDIIQRFIK